MKILKFLFLSVLFIGLYSCSSSEDNDGGSSTTVQFITITASTTTQVVGEPVTFTVLTDTNEDVTANATISAGNTIVSDASFTTSNVGDIEITANYAGKKSTVTVKFIDVPPTSIILTANSLIQSTGDETVFTVKTDTGINVTQSANITVNGNSINGSTFTSSTAGDFEVIATYEDFTSTAVIVNYTEAINFTKRVLIEDYTGTWCGYCPRVSFGIEQVKAQTDFAVPVAIHRGNDPYNFSGAGALENLIGLAGYPTAMLNRLTEWKYPEPNNVNQVVNLTQGVLPKLGIAMTANVSGGNVNLTVKTKFGKDITGAKLVVYVLENGLIYNQVNYTSYYGGGSTIVGFTHDHVLRAVYTNILGDVIPDSESVYDNVYTKTYSVAVPSNIANVSNMEFVAFVVGSDKKAINVRKAVSGDDQSFEVIE